MLKNYINRQPWFVRRSHVVPQATYIASLGWVGGTLAVSVEAYLRNARRWCGNGSCLNVRTETHLWWKLRSITAESVVSTLAQQARQDASEFSLCVFVLSLSGLAYAICATLISCFAFETFLCWLMCGTDSLSVRKTRHAHFGEPRESCKQYLLVSDTLHLIKPLKKYEIICCETTTTNYYRLTWRKSGR